MLLAAAGFATPVGERAGRQQLLLPLEASTNVP